MQDQNNPLIGYLTAVEAAKLFGISNDHVASLVRKDKVEGMLLGRVRYVKEESLKKYIAAVDAERSERKAQLSKQIKSEYIARAAVAPAEKSVKDIKPWQVPAQAPLPSPYARDAFAPRHSRGRVLAQKGLSFALLMLVVGVGAAYARDISSNIEQGASTLASAYGASVTAFVNGTLCRARHRHRRI